jgi:hypothetical protein
VHNRSFKLPGALLLGVGSSLIAWFFTVDWRWAALVLIFVVLACAIAFNLPLILTNTLVRVNRSGILKVYASQYAAERVIRDNLLPHCKEIDALTIRGFGIFALKDSLLQMRILQADSNVKIRILVLDPSSPKCKQRAEEIGESLEDFAQKLTTVLGALKALRERRPLNVQYRLYNQLPVWRLLRIDDSMFVSAFLPGKDGHTGPMYQIHRGAAMTLFPAFARQFDEIWDRGEDKL